MGFLDEIMEGRAYITAKGMTDAATSQAARMALPPGRMFELVTEIEFEIAAEELAKRKNNG